MNEKRLWIWTFAVIAAIFSSLFIGQPFASQLADPNVQAIFFVFGMLLVSATILIQGRRNETSGKELWLRLGILAVYLMLIFRLGAPERSHLIEYGVLAVFLLKALKERAKQNKLILHPAILAFVLAFSIGVLDECLQIVLPHRVFDPKDILFNGIAAAMAIGTSQLLNWVRNRNNT